MSYEFLADKDYTLRVDDKIVGAESMTVLASFNRFMLLTLSNPLLGAVDYVTFYEELAKESPAKQEEHIRMSVALHDVGPDEILAIMKYIRDPNGIRVSRATVAKMPPNVIHECITQVFLKVSRYRITLASREEVKRVPDFSIDVRDFYVKFPSLDLEELLNIAFLEGSKNALPNSKDNSQGW